MKPIPDCLLAGPFTRAEALAAKVSSRMLEGRRFVRLYPQVWRAAAYEMTDADWLTAARLALPATAQLTGLSRIRQLGLDYGPSRPLQFVVEGDLHLDVRGIFLHRTCELPPTDAVGVTPAAAYLSYVASARVIDAIKVGDWLLAQKHMTRTELTDLALSALWRDGAHEASWIIDHLDGRSRSVKESETRAVLTFAGLPVPLVNEPLDLGDDGAAVGDLVYVVWRVVIEYEGAQHQEDRAQYVTDLSRYAAFRRHDLTYVQVTKEKLDVRRAVVGEVYRALLAGGFTGPPPTFGEQWRLLDLPVSVAVGSRRDRVLAARAAQR